MLMFISIWWEMNDLTSFLTHNILNLNIVWISDTVSLSCHSMSIVCCLPFSKYTDLIHHRCLWYTCCTIDSKICLWICAGWHTSTPRNCITALWSCLDRFTTFVISKLRCNAVCPVGSPSQFYCSAQVSASLLLSQTCSCDIYTITAGLWMGYSSTCVILAKALNKGLLYFVWVLWLERY